MCLPSCHGSILQTCFLFVAKTFLDSLSAGFEPKKSRADVTFCGVSLRFTGLNREKKEKENKHTDISTLVN